MTSTIHEGQMDEEQFTITITRGGTYTSSLSKVYGVQCTPAADVDARIHPIIASDGRTITFYTSNATAAQKIFVTLKGRK